MKRTASPSGSASSGFHSCIASTALRSRSSAVEGRIPAANRSSSDATVSSSFAYPARITARAGGRGCTRRRSRVKIPSVPSEPTNSFVRSMPLEDLSALERTPPVVMTEASGRTTSAPRT